MSDRSLYVRDNSALIAAVRRNEDWAIKELNRWFSLPCVNEDSHELVSCYGNCKKRICLSGEDEYDLFWICSPDWKHGVSKAQMNTLKAYIVKWGLEYKYTKRILWKFIREGASDAATEVLIFYCLRNSMKDHLARLKNFLMANKEVYRDFACYAEDREWIGSIPNHVGRVTDWFLLAVELTLVSLLKQGDQEALLLLLALAKGTKLEIQKQLVEAAKEDTPYASIARRIMVYHVINALKANARAYILSDAMMMYQDYMRHYKK